MASYTFTGRVIYAVIYAALQAFITACAAWLTARMLGSRLVRTAARTVVRLSRLLGWLAERFFVAIGAVTVQPARALWRGLCEIAADARDAAIMRSLERAEVF